MRFTIRFSPPLSFLSASLMGSFLLHLLPLRLENALPLSFGLVFFSVLLGYDPFFFGPFFLEVFAFLGGGLFFFFFFPDWRPAAAFFSLFQTPPFPISSLDCRFPPFLRWTWLFPPGRSSCCKISSSFSIFLILLLFEEITLLSIFFIPGFVSLFHPDRCCRSTSFLVPMPRFFEKTPLDIGRNLSTNPRDPSPFPATQKIDPADSLSSQD